MVGRHEPAGKKTALVFMIVAMNGCVCHYLPPVGVQKKAQEPLHRYPFTF
jgi:hypothetical protein